jgi:hypothetical protein
VKKFLVAAFAVGAIAVPSALSAPAGKVTVCHNTASVTNPVVVIEVSGAGADNGHTGPGFHQASGDSYGEQCSPGSVTE